MDQSDIIEIELDAIAQGGEAVGRWDGRAVFVAGGLPGERVQVRLTARHATYARGTTLAVLVASPERVVPRMPDAGHASWQHIAYPTQLRYKRQILIEQLQRLGGLSVPVDEMVPSPQIWAYRASARLHASQGLLGYHATGTQTIVHLPEDPLLVPVLNTALSTLHPVARGARGLHTAVLRASYTDGYAIAALYGDDLHLRTAQAWRAACPPLAGVTLVDDIGLVERHGAGQLVEELGGVTFRLAPESFFQVNVVQAEMLLALAREALAPIAGGRLLDAYSGVGAFALPLARDLALARVLAVEASPAAVADGRAAASDNGIGQVEFIQGSVETVLPGLDERFDAVLLDPPRRGCGSQVLADLVRLAPARIVYISCHPGTLARDLGQLAADYEVVHVTPVDMFPQTPHIESVTTLVRRGG